jgi:hypothetical protein
MWRLSWNLGPQLPGTLRDFFFFFCFLLLVWPHVSYTSAFCLNICMHAFNRILTMNNDYFSQQQELIISCNADPVCFLWGRNWSSIYTHFTLSLWRPGFDPKSVNVRFAFDKMAVGQLFCSTFSQCTPILSNNATNKEYKFHKYIYYSISPKYFSHIGHLQGHLPVVFSVVSWRWLIRSKHVGEIKHKYTCIPRKRLDNK